MAQLVQIIYISRSTSGTAEAAGIDPQVARILATSRANNRKNGLTGVLYFGNGCFFQCLEGEEHAVDTLYAKLEQDTRHRDLKLISRKAIATPSFAQWSMKYVPVEKAMTALLERKGMAVFDPYRFDAATTDAVIAILLGARDEAAAPPAGTARPSTAATPVTANPAPSKGVLALAGMTLLLIGFGLGKWVG